MLGIAALVAGAVDAVVGGGGLICIPALVVAGVPPHMALATNKFQSCFGTFTALLRYYRSGYFKFSQTWLGVFFTAIGAAAGAILVLKINPDKLQHIITVALILIFIWTVLNPSFGSIEKKSKLSKTKFMVIFGLLIGAYDGFFGPGTGSFWVFSLILLYGLDIKKASGHTKVFNLTSNLISIIIFLYHEQVLFKIGITMAIGQIIGANIGAHILIHGKYELIRRLFILMMAIMIAKMIYSTVF